MAIMSAAYDTCRHARIKVPKRDGLFSTVLNVINETKKPSSLSSMLEMYVSGVSTRKVSKIVEELVVNPSLKSFVSSLTETARTYG